MLKGKTKSGFQFSINENVVDDWRTLKLVRAADMNQFYVVDLVTRILGEEQEEKLIEHLEKIHGVASATVMGEEIKEIFAECSKLKNS